MTATFHAMPQMESQPLFTSPDENQPRDQPSNQAIPSHLDRNSRLSRSLFASPKAPPASVLQRGISRRESLVAKELRRVSLEKRERQLHDWTAECSKYMDAMLKTSEELKQSEQENEGLRIQIDDLQYKVDDLEKEVVDYKRCNRELQDQLALFRQRTAQSRSEAEKFKVENMILASGNVSIESYERTLEQNRQLRSDMDTMLRKSRETQAIIDKLQQENNSLRDELMHNAYKSKNEDSQDDKADPRSKRELLRVIRRAKEEKMKWETYSEDLLRSIVTRAPHVLEIRVRSNVEHCCQDEARWEAFSLSLVQTVMESHPELLECVRTPTETDHEKLTNPRKQKSKVISIV